MPDHHSYNDIGLNLMKISVADDLYRYVGDTILSDLGLKSVCLLSAFSGDGYHVVFRKSYNGNSLQSAEKEGQGRVIDAGSDILSTFQDPDRIIVRNDSAHHHDPRDRDVIEEMRVLLNLDTVHAVIPVFLGSRLVMFFILGEKISGGRLTENDISLLRFVSLQTAITMRGIQLREDRANTERLASVGLMSAAFAHEMRNSLTSLKTFAQLMPEQYGDPEFRDHFARIVPEQIRRIDGLIYNLLDVSTRGIAAGRERMNLTETIDRAVASMQERMNLEKKNIAIERRYGNHAVYITGNADMIGRALNNLLENGCQAMADRGNLSVDTVLSDVGVKILIEDTGEGIPEEKLNFIFEPFYSTKPAGTGLGLAISRRIIDDHAGSISVESSSGRGARFVVSLPLNNNDYRS
jgi:signal transduction histidine kinase